MAKLTVETFLTGPEEANSYLLHVGGDAVVIDADSEPDRLVRRIGEAGLNLTGVYVTHFHLDHFGGVRELHERFHAPVFASAGDAFLRDLPLERGGFSDFAELADFPFEPIGPGRRTVLGQTMLVLDTPGHTPGSLSYFFPAAGCVFTGDLLFMIAVGRTDLPGGDPAALRDSILSRIFILPDDTRIYSGHGPMTTVTHEKRNNPHFRK
ncbi:MBL fold metallo-hydrolase [Pseudodesulfovibrio sp.]|uniref:MBL fold metallo-hydrolase n=1 Tax=Pseudodesulfovibrio sp. TaxID=2035812 RepID=UPI002617B0A8|nr:MBL fold metallo-hydrolase [Pseudodesulfovibrio sp.]MDD3310755.1 MBL fold metallo-hydrolase [Pseudodesulfovibrio sp.]